MFYGITKNINTLFLDSFYHLVRGAFFQESQKQLYCILHQYNIFLGQLYFFGMVLAPVVQKLQLKSLYFPKICYEIVFFVRHEPVAKLQIHQRDRKRQADLLFVEILMVFFHQIDNLHLITTPF